MEKVSASIDSSLAARKKGSSYDSSKSDAELAEEMKLMQRIRMGPRSEFESAPLYGDTEHEKGSAVRRKIGETMDNVDRGISESYRAHVDSTRTALHNLNGKGKGDAVRRFFLKANPLSGVARRRGGPRGRRPTRCAAWCRTARRLSSSSASWARRKGI